MLMFMLLVGEDLMKFTYFHKSKCRRNQSKLIFCIIIRGVVVLALKELGRRQTQAPL